MSACDFSADRPHPNLGEPAWCGATMALVVQRRWRSRLSQTTRRPWVVGRILRHLLGAREIGALGPGPFALSGKGLQLWVQQKVGKESSRGPVGPVYSALGRQA